MIQSGPAVDVVKRLAADLTTACNRPDVLEHLQIKKREFGWEERVVRSPEANAFCLPGGKIVVYTGIFPIAATDAGLAAVMGHEIGHALASHGAERMAQQQMVQIGQQAVVGAIGDMDVDQQRAILGVLGAGSQFGILLPFSRKHESEADHIGLILMAAAGYDPHHAITLWENMAKHSKGQPLEFTSTHPSHETRIRDIEGWLDDANAFYKKAEPKRPDQPLPIIGAERSSTTPHAEGGLGSELDRGNKPPARHVPAKVQQVLKFVDEHDEAPAGYEGGRSFGNFERHLHTHDKSGRPIKYREWDVNPLQPGVNRGPERLVTGSDGTAYYTADHYQTFQRIR